MKGRFEDLIVWQRSRALAGDVYRKFRESKDFGFKDQIQRASVSVMNNLAEGHEKRTSAQWREYLYTSKGSAGEVRSMLYLAHDLGYIDEKEKTQLIGGYEEVSKMIAAIIRSLKL